MTDGAPNKWVIGQTSEESDSDFAQILTDSGYWIASVSKEFADLIVAAPELLRVLRYLQNFEHHDGEIPSVFWEIIKLAIAEAEGRDA